MFIFGNLFITVGRLLSFLISIYIPLIIIRALMSWFNPDPFNKVVRVIIDLTEPFLGAIRRILPATGGFDLSPVAAIAILYFTRNFVVMTLIDLGYSLR